MLYFRRKREAPFYRSLSSLLLGMFILWPNMVPAETLTLAAAQAIALHQNPGLATLTQKIIALQHQSVAIAQLPDPHLSLGAENLPTNNFSMNEQQMSMLSIGLSQTFPSFGELSLKGQQAQTEVTASAYSLMSRSATLILLLRRAWIEVVGDQKEMTALRKQLFVAHQTIRAAMAAYRDGHTSESNVLRTQLVSEALENNQDQLQARYQANMAQVAAILNLSRPLQIPPTWPHLPTPPPLTRMIAHLSEQPLLKTAAAQTKAARLGIRVARTAYLPNITVSTAYGQDFAPGSPNWLSVGVSLSLPIFPEDRQDQKVAAAQAQSIAAQDNYDAQRLSLESKMRSANAEFKSYQLQYYRVVRKLLPTSRAAFHAALASFAANRTDLSSVLQAQNTILATRITAIDLRQKAYLSQSELDFLATEWKGDQS